MDHRVGAILYAVAMAALIIAVDVLFLSDRPLLRLAVNVGIVAIFAGGYFTVSRQR